MKHSLSLGFIGWIDRLKWWYLLFAVFLLTFGGALLYTIVHQFDPTANILPTYLKEGETDTSSLFTRALYFSVVTEATLGYGDYRPTGLNRFFACLQVLLGYALFGIVIAKLTSALGAQSRRLQRLVCGKWYNYTKHEDGRVTIDICEIFPSPTAWGLRFCGANYSESGELLGPYESDLVSESWPLLTFIYRNAPNKGTPWTEGMMLVLFSENGDEPAKSFTGTVREFRDARVDSFAGWRLDTEPALLAKLQAGKDAASAIQELAARHKGPPNFDTP